MTAYGQTYANIISFFKKNIIKIPAGNGVDFNVNDIVIFGSGDGSEDAGKIIGFDNDAHAETDNEETDERFVILRKATLHDLQKIESYNDRRSEIIRICQQHVEALHLNMYVFDASYSFDGKRIAFLFTSDERVDFRELVKKLAAVFKKQIHLHQVGPRDRTRIKGGCGKCGREICCKSWLRKLSSITMDIAREQGLEGKGGSKLSGLCGKLLCCLKYEAEEYKRMKEGLPSIRSIVETKDGTAEVIGLDILNRKIKILFEEGKLAVVSDKDIMRIIKSAEIEEQQQSEDMTEII